MNKFKAVVLLLTLCLTSLALLLLKTDLFQHNDLLQNPPAKVCGECHGDIFKAWKKSRHSMAWTSEGYKKETEGHRKQKCLGCHIPREITHVPKPEPREFHQTDGISCIACHFNGKGMRGPYQVFSPPHPSEEDGTYKKSELCKGCHAKSFKEWRETGSKKSCQECHMPGQKKKMIQVFPYDLLPIHYKVMVADHRTPVVPATGKEVRLKATIEKGTLKVILKNIGVPHNIPTAENGDSRLYLEVAFFAGDTLLAKEKNIFAPQLETALKWNDQWTADFPAPAGTDKIRVSLLLRRSWKKDKETLIIRELRL